MTISFMKTLIELIQPEGNTFTINSMAERDKLLMIVADHFEQISTVDEQLDLLQEIRDTKEGRVAA